MNKNQLLQQIDTNLAAIKSRCPLSQTELRELSKSLKVMFTYHSNAIEGNTITMGETKILLEDGLTIGGKTIREINEVLNHNQVFELLQSSVTEQRPIDEKLVKDLHKLVLHNIDEKSGKYRAIQAYISGDEIMPPAAKNIQTEMDNFFAWLRASEKNLHPAEFAAELHYRFVKIHPFIDGNGRTIRVLINIALMQAGFPITIIPNIRRMEYIQSLHSSVHKDRFILFLLDVILQNTKDYLRMITP
jgi:Fic family protein